MRNCQKILSVGIKSYHACVLAALASVTVLLLEVQIVAF